jgi:hypothetical protein
VSDHSTSDSVSPSHLYPTVRAVTAIARGSDVVATLNQLTSAPAAASTNAVVSIMIGIPGAIPAVAIAGAATAARLPAMGRC